MKKNAFFIFFAIFFVIISFMIIFHKTKQKDNELVFWTLQMRDFAPYIEKVIADFEAQNPDIKIKWIDIPFSEGEKRTLAAILSNNPPDLINLNPDFSALLAQKGTLYEINENSLNQFSPQIISNLKIEGKNYLIPWYATSAITFINSNKGLNSTPRTYNDILTYCNTTTQKSIMMFNFSENDSMLKLLNKYGIAKKEEINSLQSISLFKSLQKAYTTGCFPKDSINQTHREALEKFIAEETSVFEGGANFLNLIKENSPKTYSKIKITTQLTGSTGKYHFSVMNFVIPVKSSKQQEALSFALFLTNKENQLELGKITNVLATNQEALQDKFYTQSSTKDLQTQARIQSAKQLKKIQPIPFYQNRKELINLINNATQQILLNQDSVENILNKLKDDWAKL